MDRVTISGAHSGVPACPPNFVELDESIASHLIRYLVLNMFIEEWNMISMEKEEIRMRGSTHLEE